MTMTARIMIESPHDVVVTLKITATIRDIEDLRDQLNKSYPSWVLSAILSDAIMKARAERQNTDGTTRIVLPESKEVVIDDEDNALVAGYKWHARRYRNTFYVVACKYHGNYKQETIYMHRLITRAPKGVLVDHINGDGLDNRRTNLRFCTTQENLRNQHAVRGASRFKGVSWDSNRKKWLSQIRVDGKQIFLARHASEIEAAKNYDTSARHYFGAFARVNFE